jgi:hypothetical protein
MQEFRHANRAEKGTEKLEAFVKEGKELLLESGGSPLLVHQCFMVREH